MLLKDAGLTAAVVGLDDVDESRFDALRGALAKAEFETEELAAHHAQVELLPAMTAVRSAADALEHFVADDLWPLPTYQEMLFIL